MSKSLIAGVIFSFLYALLIVLAQKFVRGDINPIQLNFFSYLIATILVSASALNNKIRKRLFKIDKKGLYWGVLTGLVGSVAGDGLILFGLIKSSAVNWSLLSRLILPVTFLLTVFFGIEKSNLFKWLSLLVSISGAYLLIQKSGQPFLIGQGDILFLLAVASYSIGNIFSHYSLQRLSPSQLLAARLFVAAPVWCLITFFFARKLDFSFWWYMAINGLAIIAGIWLTNFIISKSGASFYSLITSLVPLITLVFSMYFFGEFPEANQIFGGELVILSIFIFQIKGNPLHWKPGLRN